MRADLTHGNLFIRSFISVMFIARILSPSELVMLVAGRFFWFLIDPQQLLLLQLAPLFSKYCRSFYKFASKLRF